MNSRYYDAQWGRFLNGDNYGGQIGELLSHNVYAYCGNNPINRYDPTGMFWAELVETVKQITQQLAPAYAGSAAPAFLDGPLPFGDVITVVAWTALAVGTVAVATYTVATMPKVISISTDRVTAIPRAPSKPTQYWAADSNANRMAPLTYSGASSRVAMGRRYNMY